MRHGDAVDLAAGGYARDADRPLSDAGREEVRMMAAALGRLGLALDLLLTSPLTRAAQTSALLAETLPVARGPVTLPALAPGGDPAAVLEAAGAGRRVMLVGHLPSLAELAGWLAWGEPALAVPLRTAGICRIDCAGDPRPGAGDLRWLLAPGLVRRLAGDRAG